MPTQSVSDKRAAPKPITYTVRLTSGQLATIETVLTAIASLSDARIAVALRALRDAERDPR